jgi:hypothetical protein
VFTVGNPVTEWRSPTLATKYWKCRDFIDSGDIHCEYISTDDNIADALTKPLSGYKFTNFCSELLGSTPTRLNTLRHAANRNHRKMVRFSAPDSDDLNVDELIHHLFD